MGKGSLPLKPTAILKGIAENERKNEKSPK